MLLQGAKIISHIYHEMALHIDYCKGFGASKEEIETSEESQGMMHHQMEIPCQVNVL